MENGEERVMNVDTAISSEHARIEFDSATGQFFICDGTADKPSTNGTWFRCAQSFSFFTKFSNSFLHALILCHALYMVLLQTLCC